MIGLINPYCLQHILLFLQPEDIWNIEKAYPEMKSHTYFYWKKLTSIRISFSLHRDVKHIKINRNISGRNNISMWYCGGPTKNKVLTKLRAYSHNLKFIEIESNVYDSELNILFGKNVNLEHVIIKNNELLNGLCLRSLPNNLKKLELYGNDSFNDITLLNNLQRLNIKSLKINTKQKDLPFLRQIFQTKPNLEEFSLIDMHGTPIEYVRLFQNVKRLYLHAKYFFCDELLQLIARNCSNLEMLGLNTFHKDVMDICSYSFVYLNCLTKLKHLVLENTEMAGTEYISYFVTTKNIEIFEVRCCKCFNDEAAQNIITNSSRLRRLEIHDCPVTDEFLKIAVTELERQNNRVVPLKIVIINSSINPATTFRNSQKFLKFVIIQNGTRIEINN